MVLGIDCRQGLCFNPWDISLAPHGCPLEGLNLFSVLRSHTAIVQGFLLAPHSTLGGELVTI